MSTKKPIYIFGHMNPDTDSTCSAIAYAHLKNLIDKENEYIAILLGNINDETAFVLDYFNISKPSILTSLRPQVSDLDIKNVACVHQTDSIKSALEVIINQPGRLVPVVDENERLIGVVSISDIVPLMLQSHGSPNGTPLSLSVSNLINTLELSILLGKIKSEHICGHVYMYNDLTTFDHITENDIVVCNRLEYLNKVKFESSAGYIIITDFKDEDYRTLDVDFKGVIMTSKKSTYEIIQCVNQALPIVTVVRKEQLEYFATYETIVDVKKNMLTSKHHRFPVVDDMGYIKGMLSRGDLIDVEHKRAILVDHNERGQSIDGVEYVNIIEVIDHHRVADIQTMTPLYFRVEPVGSTCTIVSKMYIENNVVIPREMAGLLLSGILSDTLIFKSPTCTDEDIKIAEHLAAISDINMNLYGMKMLTKGEHIEDKEPKDIIASDMKKFTFGQYKVVISQINTGDFEGVFRILPQIIQAMEEKSNRDDLDLVVLMVTNIVVGGTELIAVGQARWIAENAFNMGKDDLSIFLNQTFSRKKQVVPKLMKAAQL